MQRTIEQLLAELQASEHDMFVSHLYRSRREYRYIDFDASLSRDFIQPARIGHFAWQTRYSWQRAEISSLLAGLPLVLMPGSLGLLLGTLR